MLMVTPTSFTWKPQRTHPQVTIGFLLMRSLFSPQIFETAPAQTVNARHLPRKRRAASVVHKGAPEARALVGEGQEFGEAVASLVESFGVTTESMAPIALTVASGIVAGSVTLETELLGQVSPVLHGIVVDSGDCRVDLAIEALLRPLRAEQKTRVQLLAQQGQELQKKLEKLRTDRKSFLQHYPGDESAAEQSFARQEHRLRRQLRPVLLVEPTRGGLLSKTLAGCPERGMLVCCEDGLSAELLRSRRASADFELIGASWRGQSAEPELASLVRCRPETLKALIGSEDRAIGRYVERALIIDPELFSELATAVGSNRALPWQRLVERLLAVRDASGIRKLRLSQQAEIELHEFTRRVGTAALGALPLGRQGSWFACKIASVMHLFSKEHDQATIPASRMRHALATAERLIRKTTHEASACMTDSDRAGLSPNAKRMLSKIVSGGPLSRRKLQRGYNRISPVELDETLGVLITQGFVQCRREDGALEAIR